MNRGTGSEETGKISGFAGTRRALLRSCLTAFLVLSLVEAGSEIARAVPALGVATTGTYYYSETPQLYQTYFATSTAPVSANEGFGIGPSGSTLDIFSNISGEDIYLLTNANVIAANDPTFDGKTFTQFSYASGTVPKSYNPIPYYGIDLGQVGYSGWSSLPNPPFPNTPTASYYDYSGTLDYTGTIAQGSYFFAVATTGTSPSLYVTNFSPATTSAVGTGGGIANTPENPSLLLTGSALLFLAVSGLRRKRALRA